MNTNITNKKSLMILLMLLLVLFVFNSVSGKGTSDVPVPIIIGPMTAQAMPGDSVLFYVNWNIPSAAFTNLSGYIFSYSIDNGAWTNDSWKPMTGVTNWSNVTKVMPPSIHNYTWQVYANDSDGNWDTKTGKTQWAILPIVNISWVSPPPPPVVTISAPTNTTYIANSVWTNVSIDQNASWCGYSLDKTANVTMSGSNTSFYKLQSSISEGMHNVTVYCNNSAGSKSASSTVYLTVVYPPPLALSSCTSDYINSSLVIHLSQKKACGNDTIGLAVSNISWCDNQSINVTFDTPSSTPALCNSSRMKITDGESVCFFSTPTGYLGEKDIWVNVIDNTGVTKSKNVKFTIASRPSFQMCFNKYGVGDIWCNQACTDNPIKRTWQNVYSVSLPLHFTFGITDSLTKNYSSLANVTTNSQLYGFLSGNLTNCGAFSSGGCGCKTCATLYRPGPNAVSQNLFTTTGWTDLGVYSCNATASGTTTPANSYYTPPNIINSANNPVVIKAPNYLTSGCKDMTGCSAEMHNITRYKYEWDMSYDLIVTAYSKTDYVPMFVGFNQTSDSGFLGGTCAGNSLCYTEVPMCGDNECEVSSGENCLTCPSDCGGTADGGIFEGHCAYGTDWCTGCRVTDYSIDERGCFITKKNETEDCECASGQCMSGLTCTWSTIQGPPLSPKGKCCPTGQIWNTLYNHCEKPRGLVITDIEFEFKDNNNWLNCCPCSDKFKWLRANYTIQNVGTAKETFTVQSGFSQEDCPGAGCAAQGPAGTSYPKYFTEQVTNLTPGDSATVSFHWSCVRTSMETCDTAFAERTYDSCINYYNKSCMYNFPSQCVSCINQRIPTQFINPANGQAVVCPESCIYRNNMTLTTGVPLQVCPQECIAKIGNCSITCANKIFSCGIGYIEPTWDCLESQVSGIYWHNMTGISEPSTNKGHPMLFTTITPTYYPWYSTHYQQLFQTDVRCDTNTTLCEKTSVTPYGGSLITGKTPSITAVCGGTYASEHSGLDIITDCDQFN